jgi:endonuclease/exonuclease/phosphatase (EEP) superfamily protein YafD
VPRTALAWLLVVPFVLWAIVRLTGVELGWPAPQLLAFTPYAAVAAVVAGVVALALRQRLPAALGVVSGLVLLAVVAPRAIGDRDEPPEGARAVRVLTVNVSFGAADARDVVALVRRTRADVLSLQELTPDGDARLRRAGLSGVLPHRAAEPLPGAAGMAIYSRFALRREPEPAGTTFPFVTATIDVPGAERVRVTAVHPAAPSLRGETRKWRRDLAALPAASEGDVPRILAGDFNATLDHPELREILDTGYADAAEEAGSGLRPTYPGLRRYPPLVHIDHILVPEDAELGRVEIDAVEDTDHRAVFAEVFLPRLPR